MGNVEQTLCRSQSASVGGAVTMSRGANRASAKAIDSLGSYYTTKACEVYNQIRGHK